MGDSVISWDRGAPAPQIQPALNIPRIQPPRSGWTSSPFRKGGRGDFRQLPHLGYSPTVIPAQAGIHRALKSPVGVKFIFAQMDEAEELDEVIRKNLEGLGYGG